MEEETLNSWKNENKEALERLSVSLSSLQHDRLNIRIGNYQEIMLMVPCQDGHNYTSFMVMPCNEENTDWFGEFLMQLNAKLERFTSNHEIISALDCALKAIEKFLVSINCVQEGGINASEEEEDDEKTKCYESDFQCLNSLLSNNDDENITSILPWCHVNVQKSNITMEIDYRGILYDCKHFATAIGFPFDGSLLVIEVFFDDPQMVSLDCLRRSLVYLSKSKSDSCFLTSYKDDDDCDKMLRIMDRVKRQQYGVRVLVPHLIREFCDQKRDANYGNMFVELLNFIGCGLRSYKNVCVNCKKELPPLSRSFYCDADLCLYGFQDNGMGFSVLQELQNTKLVEFEIATAKEASKTSNFNDFDPFPTFLLNSADPCSLSGLESDYLNRKNKALLSDTKLVEFEIATAIEASETSNFNDFDPCPTFLLNSADPCSLSGLESDYLNRKNKALLSAIIKSFPSAAELKNCNNEAELVFKLYKSWLKSSSSSIGSSDASSDINIIWLPYDLLRFILFTNRSILWALPDYLLLDVPTSIRQIGVIYDSETEEKFGRLRQEHGSVFSFCWSSTWNWYSLIRTGLRCSSKGRYMSDRMENQSFVHFSSKLHNPLMEQSGMTIEDTDECEVVAVCEIFSASWSSNMEEGMHINPLEVESYAIRYLILLYRDNYGYNTVKIEGSNYHNESSEPVNLLEHYTITRDVYVEDNISEGIIEREKCVELFKERKLNRKDK